MDSQNPIEQHPEQGSVVQPQLSNQPPAAGPASVAYKKPGMSRIKKKLLFAGVGATLLVALGAAGYVFGYYLPNKPENVYSRALANTSKGYDELLSYAGDEQLSKKFDTTEFSGNFKVKSGSTTADGTFEGKVDKANNATFSGDIGTMGVRIKLDGMMKQVSTSDYPDLYFRAQGIKGLDALSGLSLDKYDGQWMTIDHSLFDTYAEGLKSYTSDVAVTNSTPSREAVVDAARAMGAVNKTYLLSSDTNKAVFVLKQFRGKEVIDGKNTLHYDVSVNKAHLQTYVTELAKALDHSKLNGWSKQSYEKDLSDLMDVSQMKDDINGLNDNTTFGLWVNAKTKMVHKVRFNLEGNAKTYMDIGLNYDSGDEYPFFLNVKDSENAIQLHMSVNTKSNVVTMGADIASATNSNENMKLDMKIKPGTGKVEVNPPSDAKSLLEVYGDVLGSYYTSSLGGLDSEYDLNTANGLGDFTITQ